MRRAAVPVLLATLLAGCAAPPAPADEPTPQEVTLVPGSFFIALLDLAQPSRVHVDMRVTEGGPIDAWLAPPAACEMFTTPAFHADSEALGAIEAALAADLPAGRSCVPLQNDGVGPAVVQYVVRVG